MSKLSNWLSKPPELIQLSQMCRGVRYSDGDDGGSTRMARTETRGATVKDCRRRGGAAALFWARACGRSLSWPCFGKADADRSPGSSGQRAQHEWHYAAVAEILGLTPGVEPDDCPEEVSLACTSTSRRVGSATADARSWTVIVSAPVSPSESADCPGRNCSGKTPMPTRLERWIRSNDSAKIARTSSSFGPLAVQSRDDPAP
jgi:hypothetical protein